jgi:hypothetical protein
MAVELAQKFEPLSEVEAQLIKAKGLAETPLFQYPHEQAGAGSYHTHANTV